MTAGPDNHDGSGDDSTSDVPQPPQAPPGHPAPPTQPANTAADANSTPSNGGAPPSQPESSHYAPPLAAPGASAFGQNEPRTHNTSTVQNAQMSQSASMAHNSPTGQQYAAVPSDRTAWDQQAHASNQQAHASSGSTNPAKPARRGASVGVIAALAVGALVGGVSGAGVTAAMTANQASQVSNASSGPANITVNDPSEATTTTAVAAAAGPSVVTISVADGAGGGGTGSGVILSEDGYAITNAHVVTLDGGTSNATVSVQTSDGRLFDAEVVGSDPIYDLAVIKIDGDDDFQPAEFADSSQLNVGDIAVAIGAPLGLSNTVTNGIVSSLNRSITVASSAAPELPQEEAPEGNRDQGPFDFWEFGPPQSEQPTTPSASSTIALSVIQTDAAINPGNSGGALLDAEGRVIGINVAIASAGQGSSQSAAGSIGVGFAIPSNVAERVAREIIETGSATHGLLGASVSEVTTETADVVGALIREVTPGGAADEGRLRAGDVVTSFNDLPVTGPNDLTAQVRAFAAGSEATIGYVRDGEKATADVTLGSLG